MQTTRTGGSDSSLGLLGTGADATPRCRSVHATTNSRPFGLPVNRRNGDLAAMAQWPEAVTRTSRRLRTGGFRACQVPRPACTRLPRSARRAGHPRLPAPGRDMAGREKRTVFSSRGGQRSRTWPFHAPARSLITTILNARCSPGWTRSSQKSSITPTGLNASRTNFSKVGSKVNRSRSIQSSLVAPPSGRGRSPRRE